MTHELISRQHTIPASINWLTVVTCQYWKSKKENISTMPYCLYFAVERFEESEDRALVQMLTNQDVTSKGKITLQLMGCKSQVNTLVLILVAKYKKKGKNLNLSTCFIVLFCDGIIKFSRILIE